MSKTEKELYRRYIQRVSPYINFAGVCSALKIDYRNFKRFKSGLDGHLSVKKLQAIESFIKGDFKE